MPTIPFREFLSWSRDFIDRYGRDEWRDAWLNRHRRRPITCEHHRCSRSLLSSVEGSAYQHNACSNCARCESHCECFYCEGCSAPVDDYCGTCERCNNCCECIHCGSCREVCNRTYCGDCERCHDCCECTSEDDRNIELFTHPVQFHPAKLHERKDNPSPRFVSVEIEVAGIDSGYATAQAVRKWRGCIVEDGSLPSSGFEINTAPAAGDKFVQQIAEICGGLADGDASVTSVCGLHVHVDARDFDFYMIRRLVQVYARIEDALFGMASPSRRTSQYCHPCGASYLAAIASGVTPYKLVKAGLHKRIYDFDARVLDQLDPDERVYRGRNLRSRKKSKYDGARYNALNLHSWFYRGTVECRIFNGTTNAEKITCWGMLWARILDYVAARTDKDVAAELTGSSYDNLVKLATLPRLVAFIQERTAKFNAQKEAA